MCTKTWPSSSATTLAAPASPSPDSPNHEATGATAAPVASAAATASDSAVTKAQTLRKTARAPSKSRRATRIVISCEPAVVNPRLASTNHAESATSTSHSPYREAPQKCRNSGTPPIRIATATAWENACPPKPRRSRAREVVSMDIMNRPALASTHVGHVRGQEPSTQSHHEEGRS